MYVYIYIDTGRKHATYELGLMNKPPKPPMPPTGKNFRFVGIINTKVYNR